MGIMAACAAAGLQGPMDYPAAEIVFGMTGKAGAFGRPGNCRDCNQKTKNKDN